MLGVLGILSWPAAFGLAYYISVSTGVTYDPAFNYGSIFMVAFLLGMFALTIQFENRNALTRVVCSVGKNTLGMYLGHYLFIFLIDHFWNVEKMQERIVDFVSKYSKMQPEKFREFMLATGELATDVGTVLDGNAAVECGMIDRLGGLSDALDCLYQMIANHEKEDI